MPQLSVVIIAFNEEKYIEQCLRSVVDVADEIVVVDSFSTDITPQICEKYGAKLIYQKFLGYKEQKNFALAQAKYNCVLSLDADEALSEELKKEILLIKENWKYDGYVLKRLNNYCGRWMYHSSLYPERKLRLFDRTKGSWGGINPHDRIVMEQGATVGQLKGNLLHWLYDNYEEHLQKINQFSTISANDYFKLGIKPSFRRLFLHPTWRFLHSYFIKTGFLEGFDGFAVSILLSFHCFLKYYKLRRLYLSDIKVTKGKQPFVSHITIKTVNDQHNIRIGFDAKRAFYNHSGLGNYSRNLVNALTRYYPNYTFTLYSPKAEGRIKLLREEQIKVVSPQGFGRKFLGSLWRTLFMVKRIKSEKIDVYHGLSHELPYGVKKSGAKTVVTVHDLIFIRFPHFFKPFDALIYKKKLVHACRIADKIVAISHQTKSDLIDFLKIEPERIKVIHQGCSANFWIPSDASVVEEVRRKYNLPDKYLLCVGTIEERKNLLSGIKAVHETGIDIPLVAVGRKADYFYNKVLPYVKENNVRNVIFLEGVVNEDLPIIYQNAECFIYPSLFEGFGIPLLEALVSGIPVITSSGGCFAEAAGPSSIYLDPSNHIEIAEAIRKVCGNQEIKNRMIAQGKEYAKRFSQEAIAENYMNLYKSLYNNN